MESLHFQFTTIKKLKHYIDNNIASAAHTVVVQITYSDAHKEQMQDIRLFLATAIANIKIIMINDGSKTIDLYFNLYKKDAKVNETLHENSMQKEYEIFNNGPVVIFKRVLDKDEECWVIRNVTDSVKQWGYSPEYFVQNKEAIKEMMHPDDMMRVRENVLKAVKNNESSIHQEYRIYDHNKNIHWIEDYSYVIRDVNNEPSILIGYMVDVTYARAAKESLERTQKKLSNYLNQISDIILIHTLDGRIIEANEEANRRLGYSKAELLSMHIADITHDTPQVMVSNTLSTLKMGLPVNLETLYVTKSKEIFPVEVRVGRFDAEGFVSIARDISDKKNTQVILQSREELYRGIINSTTEGFWLLDDQLNIVDVNYSLCVMLGYTREEMIGKNPYNFIDAADHDLCHEQSKTIEEVAQRVYELVFVKKTGKKIHAIANATTMYEHDGNVKTFAFMTNISKQKALEAELVKKQAEIEARNNNLEAEIASQVEENRSKDQMMYQQARLASMGEMIGNIAHQWRQPLNILALVMQDLYISGQLGNLTDEKLETEYEKANNVLQYMSQTIDDFRNFFKHEGENANFSLKSTIESVYSLVSPNFKHNHVAFHMDMQEEIEVVGNKNEFIQVIINILNNAQDAIKTNNTKGGEVHVAIMKLKDKARIVISDNGGGMSKSIIDKIFDPYFTTKHQTQGTGLGLYMSKQIIETSMTGHLMAENITNGARFIIELPIYK